MKTICCLKLCLSAAVLATHHFAAVGQDTTRPALVSASSADAARIGLCYSEAMDSSSAEDMFNYLGGIESTKDYSLTIYRRA